MLRAVFNRQTTRSVVLSILLVFTFGFRLGLSRDIWGIAGYLNASDISLDFGVGMPFSLGSLFGLGRGKDAESKSGVTARTQLSFYSSDGGAERIPVYRYPQVPLDVAGYPEAPEGLELEQVHVYVRHGERTPVGVRLATSPGNIPEHWDMCKEARKFRQAVVDSMLDLTPRFVERRDGTVAEYDCLLGELTDLGRQTTYHFGKNLRRIYVDRLGFLPDELNDRRHVYFRTTNIPRTTESLQQIINGLYPVEKCHPREVPYILTRNGKDENLVGNTHACKRLEVLQAGFVKAAADAYNPTLEPLDKQVSKYIDGGPIRVDGKPRASGVMDTIRAAVAHGIKVPPEFEDKKIVDIIERAVVAEWYTGYKTEEVRRLAMGRLLGDMQRKMTEKTEKGDLDPLKMLVHATHDTAIAGLRSTLDVFDDQWPAFTASITFELFKKKRRSSFGFSSHSNYYVRVRTQNENVTLPICAAEDKHLEGHPELCTFAAFKNRVRELTPEDWESECRV